LNWVDVLVLALVVLAAISGFFPSELTPSKKED